jgi:cell division protein FtsW
MEASIYHMRLRDILAVCVLALLVLGAIMVQSASTNVTVEPKFQLSPLGVKHLIFVALSIATFFLVGRIDYTWLERKAGSIWRSPIFWVFIIAAGFCAAVLIPHVGMSVNGARRWVKLGPVQIQPSELAKWAVVLFLAWRLTRTDAPLDRFFGGFVPTLIPIGILCLLVIIQDFGTAALIALCALTMMVCGRVKLRHLLLIMVPVIAAAVWFIVHKEYRLRRITAFIHPWDNPQGEGYHMIQSLLSFSTGGLFGRGLGNGIQKLGYLPEDTTDFIFAVICEELGLFGALLTVALYVGILYVAWQIIRQKCDDFGKMLAFGIGAMTGLQAAINIAVATVSVPTKGLSLPLVSAGGSGLIISCAALGLLYAIARKSEVQQPHAEQAVASMPRPMRLANPLTAARRRPLAPQVYLGHPGFAGGEGMRGGIKYPVAA